MPVAKGLIAALLIVLGPPDRGWHTFDPSSVKAEDAVILGRVQVELAGKGSTRYCELQLGELPYPLGPAGLVFARLPTGGADVTDIRCEGPEGSGAARIEGVRISAKAGAHTYFGDLHLSLDPAREGRPLLIWVEDRAGSTREAYEERVGPLSERAFIKKLIPCGRHCPEPTDPAPE